MCTKYFRLLSCSLLALGCWSCVDIPGGPPESVFDMRAQIRFVHVGTGIDTVALALNVPSDTMHSSSASQSTIVSGADTIVVTDSAFVTVYPQVYYRRFQVDFSSALDLIEDGSKISQLNFGEATSYLNTPAGPRNLSLETMAQIVDTLIIQTSDTHHVLRRDTLGRGTSHFDTLLASKSYIVNIAASGLPTEKITADYKNPKLVILTDRKATVFFIHDLQPIIAQEDNRVRYGWINYQIADERYSDRIIRGAPVVAADSMAIRFVNASRNGTSKMFSFKGTIAGAPPTTVSVSSDNIALLSVSPYRVYPVGDYSLFLSLAGGTGRVDTLSNMPLTGHHRYTFVAVDSATTYHLRRYNDE